MQPVPVTPPPSSSNTDTISLLSINMNERPGPIYPACAAHPDCPSPNIHLTVLRLRVPHLFGSRRRPSSTRKPRIVSTVDKPSNRPANLSAALHIIVQDLSEKPSREDSDVRQSRSRFAKKLECYEFAILSRHLLTVSRSDQEFQRRWEGLLDKVEAAFAAVNPEHASSAEETNRERRPSIDQWIKDIVPRHLELIRAVYGRETKKYEQLMGLVGSLRQIQKNLLSLSDTVPTRQKDRRRQLYDLLQTILTGLERQQVALQSRIEEGHLSQAEDLADAGDFNDFSVAYDALDLPPDPVMQPAPDLLAQGVNNLDESLTTSMGYTTTQDVGEISQGRVDDTGTSQATQDEVQPVAALGLERHPSESSEKSMRTRTSESARSRSSSPRGHAHPVSTRAIGGAFPTSTPKTKMRDESRKTSGSSRHFSNLSIPAIMPYQVPQEFLQWQASERDFYERRIAEAVAREKEARKREVELVMQQVELVKQQVDMWMSLAAKYEDEAKELKARNNELLDRLLKA